MKYTLNAGRIVPATGLTLSKTYDTVEQAQSAQVSYALDRVKMAEEQLERDRAFLHSLIKHAPGISEPVEYEINRNHFCEAHHVQQDGKVLHLKFCSYTAEQARREFDKYVKFASTHYHEEDVATS